MDKIKLNRMIEKYMRLNHLTMKELGTKLGKGESTVSYWIKGKSTPRIGEIQQMAKMFGLTTDQLIYGDDYSNDVSVHQIAVSRAMGKMDAETQSKIEESLKVLYGDISRANDTYLKSYELAMEVRQKYVKTYPVDPFEVIKAINPDIDVISFSSIGLVGCKMIDIMGQYKILYNDNKYKHVILYNDKKQIGTIRFTLMHELGHYLFGHLEDTKQNDNLVNCFARNVLAPVCMIESDCSESELMKDFGITVSAARTRIDFYERDLKMIDNLI